MADPNFNIADQRRYDRLTQRKLSGDLFGVDVSLLDKVIKIVKESPIIKQQSSSIVVSSSLSDEMRPSDAVLSSGECGSGVPIRPSEKVGSKTVNTQQKQGQLRSILKASSYILSELPASSVSNAYGNHGSGHPGLTKPDVYPNLCTKPAREMIDRKSQLKDWNDSKNGKELFPRCSDLDRHQIETGHGSVIASLPVRRLDKFTTGAYQQDSSDWSFGQKKAEEQYEAYVTSMPQTYSRDISSVVSNSKLLPSEFQGDSYSSLKHPSLGFVLPRRDDSTSTVNAADRCEDLTLRSPSKREILSEVSLPRMGSWQYNAASYSPVSSVYAMASCDTTQLANRFLDSLKHTPDLRRKETSTVGLYSVERRTSSSERLSPSNRSMPAPSSYFQQSSGDASRWKSGNMDTAIKRAVYGENSISAKNQVEEVSLCSGQRSREWSDAGRYGAEPVDRQRDLNNDKFGSLQVNVKQPQFCLPVEPVSRHQLRGQQATFTRGDNSERDKGAPFKSLEASLDRQRSSIGQNSVDAAYKLDGSTDRGNLPSCSEATDSAFTKTSGARELLLDSGFISILCEAATDLYERQNDLRSQLSKGSREKIPTLGCDEDTAARVVSERGAGRILHPKVPQPSATASANFKTKERKAATKEQYFQDRDDRYSQIQDVVNFRAAHELQKKSHDPIWKDTDERIHIHGPVHQPPSDSSTTKNHPNSEDPLQVISSASTRAGPGRRASRSVSPSTRSGTRRHRELGSTSPSAKRTDRRQIGDRVRVMTMPESHGGGESSVFWESLKSQLGDQYTKIPAGLDSLKAYNKGIAADADVQKQPNDKKRSSLFSFSDNSLMVQDASSERLQKKEVILHKMSKVSKEMGTHEEEFSGYSVAGAKDPKNKPDRNTVQNELCSKEVNVRGAAESMETMRALKKKKVPTATLR